MDAMSFVTSNESNPNIHRHAKNQDKKSFKKPIELKIFESLTGDHHGYQISLSSNLCKNYQRGDPYIILGNFTFKNLSHLYYNIQILFVCYLRLR
jgi:hypothetical protein